MARKKLSDKWKSLSNDECEREIIAELKRLSPGGICVSEKDFNNDKAEWMPKGSTVCRFFGVKKWSDVAAIAGLEKRRGRNSKLEQKAMQEVIDEVKNNRTTVME